MAMASFSPNCGSSTAEEADMSPFPIRKLSPRIKVVKHVRKKGNMVKFDGDDEWHFHDVVIGDCVRH